MTNLVWSDCLNYLLLFLSSLRFYTITHALDIYESEILKFSLWSQFAMKVNLILNFNLWVSLLKASHMIKYYSNLDLDSYLKFILGKGTFCWFCFPGQEVE